jgi:CubicO group peptidase (beta-lactamase class C family)
MKTNNRDLAQLLQEQLDPMLQQVVASFQLPGLAAGVVSNGELVYARGFGVTSLETGAPVTPSSLFHMASVSKTFVATALAQLAERGKVDLGAPVVRCLPYFRLADERFPELTIHQLLTHTSGMPDVEDYHWDRPEEDDGALERFVRSLANETLLFPPGQKFEYSNMAYEILGDVIAKVSGMTFEDYLKVHILDPLGMHASTFLKREVSADLAAFPHVYQPEIAPSQVYPYHRAHAPSSTLHSNVLELGNWAMANLNRGVFKGERILAAASYELLWKPYQATSTSASQAGGKEAFVGLSWFIGEHKGYLVIGHSGEDIGFMSRLALLPEAGLAVIVLINAIPAPEERILDAALDLSLGFEPRPIRPPAMITVGRTLARGGLEAAREHLLRLGAGFPGDYDFSPDGFIDSAFTLVELGNAPAAIDVMRLCVAVNRDSSEAFAWLGWACSKAGEKAQALESLEKSLALNPDNEHAAGLRSKMHSA